MERSELTIVVPTYNEADALAWLLPELIGEAEKHNWHVVFVDGGSTDKSIELIAAYSASCPIKVIRQKLNRGYGGALKSGIGAATTRWVVTFDSDGQHIPTEIGTLLRCMEQNDADMVIGSRQGQNAQEYYRNRFERLYREAGKRILLRIASTLVPLTLHDLSSGFKLYDTQLAQRYATLCPDSAAFTYAITLLMVSQKHLVLEQPIKMRDRSSGISAVNTRVAFDSLFEILNICMLVNPQRIFLPLAAMCFLAGFLWGIPFVALGRGVSVGAMLAIVSGLMLFTFGLLAHQLAALRLSSVADRPAAPQDEHSD